MASDERNRQDEALPGSVVAAHQVSQPVQTDFRQGTMLALHASVCGEDQSPRPAAPDGPLLLGRWQALGWDRTPSHADPRPLPPGQRTGPSQVAVRPRAGPISAITAAVR